MKTNAMGILDSAGIDYDLKIHSKPVYTAVDASKERGVRLEQVVKTMLVERQSGQVVMVLVPGDRRLNLKRLAKILGEENVALLSARSVNTVTGYEVGSVSPIGIKSPVQKPSPPEANQRPSIASGTLAIIP